MYAEASLPKLFMCCGQFEMVGAWGASQCLDSIDGSGLKVSAIARGWIQTYAVKDISTRGFCGCSNFAPDDRQSKRYRDGSYASAARMMPASVIGMRMFFIRRP
jgi:hypothetical protein